MSFSFPAAYTPPVDSRNANNWGQISGSISDQADLKEAFDQVQDALDAKVLNEQADDYTLVLSDANGVIVGNVGTDIEITLPANADVTFPIGTVIDLLRLGAGNVDILPDTGVTLNALDGKQRIIGLYGVARLLKVATNVWVLSGDLDTIPV